jgi:phenylacetate-CoA ligase
MLAKSVYNLGIRFRNDKIPVCYQKLKDSECWNLEKLREQQLLRLRELVDHAYRNSPYYRKKYREAGFAPPQLTALEDLARLPMLTKQEVLDHGLKIQAPVQEKLYYSETSGSTGKPLVFHRNQEWDAYHNASVMRGCSWHNVAPWERNGYLWGYNLAPDKVLKTRALDLLQNRFRLFSYKEAEMELFLDKLEKAVFLNGYSSMVYELAKRVNGSGRKRNFRLKMVKCTSEKIYDSYRQEVREAFGREIVSEYGSAEGGIIAFGCAHGRMHLNMETVIAEIVDNEIVVTNLVSRSFPIIRYKLGDYVTMGEGGCPCGMAHPVVQEVTGRVGSLIYGRSGTYPSLTLYYVFKNLALTKSLVLNYQVLQTEPGKIKVLIETRLRGRELTLLNSEFDKYFAGDMEIEVLDGQVREDYRAKRKDFISMIS